MKIALRIKNAKKTHTEQKNYNKKSPQTIAPHRMEGGNNLSMPLKPLFISICLDCRCFMKLKISSIITIMKDILNLSIIHNISIFAQWKSLNTLHFIELLKMIYKLT